MVAELEVVTEEEALDAYSSVVTSVAERLVPSVANLQVQRGRGGGGGSAFALTRDGFLVTSAHVVDGVTPAFAGVGLGLAVPINATTQLILAALMKDGRVRRAFLGIAGAPRRLPPAVADRVGHRAGIEVVEVVACSPAAAADVRP